MKLPIRAFAISLSSRDDRLFDLKKMLDLRQIKYTVCHSLELGKDRICKEGVTIVRFEKDPIMGRRGCATSHLFLMDFHAKSSSSPVMILEDDCNFQSNFNWQVLDSALKLQDDLVILGFLSVRPSLAKSNSHFFKKCSTFSGTTAYIESHAACSKLANLKDALYTNANYNYPHIDLVMSYAIKNKWFSKKSCAIQRASKSDNEWVNTNSSLLMAITNTTYYGKLQALLPFQVFLSLLVPELSEETKRVIDGAV